MDFVKEAFLKVKEDIDFLYSEMNSLKEDLKQTRELFLELGEIVKELNKSSKREVSFTHIPTDRQTDRPTDPSTHNISFTTHNASSSTHPTDIKGLKPQNMEISIGNVGVPTDRQTDRQTDQHTNKSSYNSINDALITLNSLDNLKREIRLKFKRLTDQEMAVFSLLYQLSEEEGFSDYRALSLKLNLTESSIRDYIGRIIKKGIPVDKTKINNKTIQLSISSNLKKIASLQTILQLREI